MAFKEVAGIIATTCSSGSCHTRQCPPEGLALDARRIEASLLGAPSTQDPKRARVEPHHPERSYLMAKLEGRDIAPGTLRMPPGGPRLSDEQLALFRDWIASGAPIDPAALDVAPPQRQCDPVTPTEVPLAPPEKGVQVRLKPMMVPARVERTVCSVQTPSLTQPAWVAGFESESTPGVHHMALLFREGTLPEMDNIDCDMLEPYFDTSAALYSAQVHANRYVLPEGYAIWMNPGTQFIIVSHVDNVTECPIGLSSAVNVLTVDGARVTHPVSTWNMEEHRLAVPLQPDDDPSAGCNPDNWYTVAKTCLVPEGFDEIEVLAFAPHQHATGRRIEVRFFDGKDLQPDPILVSDDWLHPATGALPTGPMRLKKGQGFELTCSFYYSCAEHLQYTSAESCPEALFANGDAVDEMCNLKIWYAAPGAHDINSRYCVVP